MQQQIKSIGYEAALSELPQAVNCINYFRKLVLNALTDDLNSRVWIAGGAVRDWFSGGVVSMDIDFFCVDRKSMAELIMALRKDYGFKHYLITKNAVKGFITKNGKKIDVDIVKKPFTTPTECVDAFDFTVCCFAVQFDKFCYHTSAVFDLIKKRLVVHNLPHLVDSMKRMNKYTRKGFIACNGTILTIAKAIAEQDPTDDSIFDFYKFD